MEQSAAEPKDGKHRLVQSHPDGAQPDPHADDPDVFNGRKGQQSFQVGLHHRHHDAVQSRQGGDDHDDDPDEVRIGLNGGQHADNPENAHLDHHPRHHPRNVRRSRRVGFGKPGVKRDEPRLDGESGKEQEEQGRVGMP